MSDRISIAMTTYNGEKYLREQLDSLYSQTRIPDEIIVCDDCSKDGTAQILEEYHQKRGLKYFVNEKNLGVNKNFEKALTLCTGDYISFSDQDDIWLPQKVEKSYAKLKQIEVNGLPSLVNCNHVEINSQGKVIKKYRISDTDSYTDTLFNYYVSACMMMMNRKLLDYILPFPKVNEVYFDYYTLLTAAMIGNLSNISTPLMCYRRHDTNLVGRFKKVSNLRKFLKIFIKWDRTRYVPLFQPQRSRSMRNAARFQSKYFIEERKGFYESVCLIGEEQRFFRKMCLLRKLKELSFSQKLNATINILLNRVFPINKG